MRDEGKKKEYKPSSPTPKYSLSRASLFVVVTITAFFARTQRNNTCPSEAASRLAGSLRAAVTGPAGYWVMGLVGIEPSEREHEG